MLLFLLRDCLVASHKFTRYTDIVLDDYHAPNTVAHRDTLVRILMARIGLESCQPISPIARKSARVFFEMVEGWKARLSVLQKAAEAAVGEKASGANAALAVAGTVDDSECTAIVAVEETVGAPAVAGTVAGPPENEAAAKDKQNARGWIKAQCKS